MPHQDGLTYRWLNRKQFDINVPNLEDERIVVTGSAGYIGSRLCYAAKSLGADVYGIDLPNADVQNSFDMGHIFSYAEPTIVIHLAAHKYATTAEVNPTNVAKLNIEGTRNVVKQASNYDAKLVLASTCKAADPCTVYGASKFIAEKIVLNYDRGSVFRLVNVLGSTGSVIDIWSQIPSSEPLPVTNCLRYWIAPDEAVDFLLATTGLAHGLYAPYFHTLCSVRKIAQRYGPTRQLKEVPLRRGDRPAERIIAEYEKFESRPQSTIMKIKEPWSRESQK